MMADAKPKCLFFHTQVKCIIDPNREGTCLNCSKNNAECVWPVAKPNKVPPKVMLENLSMQVARIHEIFATLRVIQAQAEEDEADANIFGPRILYAGGFPFPRDGMDFS